MPSSLFGPTTTNSGITTPAQTTQPTANPISPANQQILDLMRIMQNNSGQLNMQSLLASNPVFQNASQMMQQIRDPKAAFYEAAKQRGIDPNAAISRLQQMLK